MTMTDGGEGTRPSKRSRLDDALFGSREVIQNRGEGADAYAADASEAITFHLVDKIAQLDDETDAAFNPEFTHQQFGDDQIIKGYKDLTIDIYMSARDFYTFIDIKFEKKHSFPEHNLPEILAETFPAGYTTKREEFAAHLKTATTLSSCRADELGHVISSRTAPDGATLEVRRVALTEASEQLRTLHARLEPLLLFYIDAASAIERNDARWFIHTVVRRTPSPTNKQEDGTDVVLGFCTLYNFFAFPDKIRTRLSQIFVLPPYQGLGIGSLLIESANAAVASSGAIELTYEDPTDAVNRIRDVIDIKRLVTQAWFVRAVKEALAQRDYRLPADVVTQARCTLQISRYQMGRIWEQVLFSMDSVQAEGAAQAGVAEVVARRLKCDADERKQQTGAGKALLAIPGLEEGSDNFIMCRVKGGGGQDEVFVEPEDVVQRRAEALGEILQERLDQMTELIPKIQAELNKMIK